MIVRIRIQRTKKRHALAASPVSVAAVVQVQKKKSDGLRDHLSFGAALATRAQPAVLVCRQVEVGAREEGRVVVGVYVVVEVGDQAHRRQVVGTHGHGGRKGVVNLVRRLKHQLVVHTDDLRRVNAYARGAMSGTRRKIV